MGLKEKVFHAMQNDPSLDSSEAFRLVTEPAVEATKLRDREATERSRTEGNPRSETAVKIAARFTHLTLTDAFLLAGAVSDDDRLDAPLAALLSDKDLPVHEALARARAEVAGKPVAARVNLNDATVKIASLFPEQGLDAARDAAVRLSASRGGLDGSLAGLTLLKRGDASASLSESLSRICGSR